ncbi:MAG TPA: hypothetical protein VMY40_06360 [Anaerolineae bacterium]|nr:hypothetical protein [Anaerolineae bacterium]
MVDEFAELEGFEDEWDPAEEVRDIEFGPSDALREFVERDEYPPLDDPMADALDLGDDDTGSRLDDLEHRLLFQSPDFTPELLDDAGELRWGKVIISWAHGENTITLNPCDSNGENVDTERTVTVYCSLPKNATPAYIHATTNDVVAYAKFTDEDGARGVLVGISHLPTIPNVANNYGLVWDAAAVTVKWVQLAAFECPA